MSMPWNWLMQGIMDTDAPGQGEVRAATLLLSQTKADVCKRGWQSVASNDAAADRPLLAEDVVRLTLVARMVVSGPISFHRCSGFEGPGRYFPRFSGVGLAKVPPSKGTKPNGRRRRASRDQPIVQSQTGDVLVIRRVVGDQRQVVDQGDGSNQQVHSADRDSLLQQRTAHLAKPFGASSVEIEYLDFLEKVGDQGQQLRRAWVLVSPCIQLGQHNCRD